MIKRTGPDPLLRSLCRAACVTLANASLVFCAGIGQAAGQASEPTPLESAQVVPETAAPSLYPPIPTRPSSASNTQAPVSLSAPTTISPGRTPGTFTVTNPGAATYTIPIWVPPGVGATQLSLALNYSSRAPDGVLGVGWTLSGFAGS